MVALGLISGYFFRFYKVECYNRDIPITLTLGTVGS